MSVHGLRRLGGAADEGSGADIPVVIELKSVVKAIVSPYCARSSAGPFCRLKLSAQLIKPT
jgi:hypothetical protein